MIASTSHDNTPTAPIGSDESEASTRSPIAVEVSPRGLRFVIGASAAGTLIEWYDFYLYAVLTPFLAPLFFPSSNPATSLIAGFATFGAGFAVRPFGAVVFGRIGDLIGRKFAFVLTVSLMGASTVVVGLLPTYATIGIAAPVILVVLRCLQGLALGGEYGGAAVYVAEHAPDGKRGYYTSWIQTTATLGLFVALAVVLCTRLSLGDGTFKAWGWRIPFLISAILVVLALYIRMRMRETPLFSKLKAAGKASAKPLRESFGSRRNWKLILLALFGVTAGQAVVWYTGQFYALFFLTSTLKVSFVQAYTIVGVSLLLGTPFFIIFGALSDRIGRKPIIMGGCLLAALTYYPLFKAMAYFASPLNIGAEIALVTIQVLYVTAVYGPVAAFLVEFFPARIRYTSLSVPYHLGNGEFGGWLPFIAGLIVAATGNKFAGLIYPIGVALMSFVIGMFFVAETNHVRIWDEVASDASGAVTAEAQS
jgi:MFS family permease